MVKQVIKQKLLKKDFIWSIAGRDKDKLDKLLNDLNNDFNDKSKPDIKVADIEDYSKLKKVIGEAKLVINCVGPFALYGEPVLKACIEMGVDYLDINGEPAFIESMYQKYNDLALKNQVTIVFCCGFDSLPADIGVLFGKEKFAESGGVCSAIEMYLELNGGDQGLSINFTTLQSAIIGMSNVDKLRALRKKITRPKLNYIGPLIPMNTNPHYNKQLNGWILPFIGADSSVVKMGQQINSNSKYSPVQFSAYLLQKKFLSFLSLIIFGLLLKIIIKFEFTKNLVLKYPEIFTLGLFKKSGPSLEQIKKSNFCETFIAKGYSNSKNISITSECDTEIIYTVSGPEAGYVTTPMVCVTCAYLLLTEKEKKTNNIPMGINTPASAFSNTQIIKNLQEQTDVKFQILSIKN